MDARCWRDDRPHVRSRKEREEVIGREEEGKDRKGREREREGGRLTRGPKEVEGKSRPRFCYPKLPRYYVTLREPLFYSFMRASRVIVNDVRVPAGGCLGELIAARTRGAWIRGHVDVGV